jgi:hypothetical protein
LPLLGGLVGNQGGIRSAAMLGFDVPKHAFVATATAVGLSVDRARLPVYLVIQGREVAALGPFLLTAAAGAVVGTLVGERLLRRIPEPVYRRLVAGLVLALGVFMLVRIGHEPSPCGRLRQDVLAEVAGGRRPRRRHRSHSLSPGGASQPPAKRPCGGSVPGLPGAHHTPGINL